MRIRKNENNSLICKPGMTGTGHEFFSRLPIDEVNRFFPKDSEKMQEMHRELNKHDPHDKICKITQRWPEPANSL